jgi:hypothetical protein
MVQTNTPKVFVTALPRTGTSSLEYALRNLGYRTVHFPHTLFENIHDDIVNSHDAFTDLPIPLIYKQMDALHPGSRFIHATRDIDGWLESMEWLFTHGSKEYHWDRWDGLIEQIHLSFYGTDTFDRDLFRSFYFNYEDDLRLYFSGRSDDFLDLQLNSPDAMEQLSTFLNKPRIKGPLPRRNSKVTGLRSIMRGRIQQVLRKARGY